MKPQLLGPILILMSSCMVKASDVIYTKTGPVTGTTAKSLSNKTVAVYLGIPYAQPPTGDLRFRPPVPVKPWDHVLQATSPPPVPYQHIPDDLQVVNDRLNSSIPGPSSEDCLTLHIWVPQTEHKVPKKFPVVVFIHGGGFMTETALWFIDGSSMAADEEIIFVSVEYRLGVFGFLYMKHPLVPGNLGLLDQILALKWVHDNIEAFGGDPEAITLMGTSAGSASVGYHMSSDSKLFRRAIMMSGVPQNPWAHLTPEQSLALTEQLVHRLDCRKESIPETLGCLQGKSPEELVEASHNRHFFASRQFLPTADSSLIEGNMDNTNTMDVLIGSTMDEGVEFFLLLKPELADTMDSGLSWKVFEEVVGKLLPDMPEVEQQLLRVLYTNWTVPDDPVALRDATRKIFGDVLFNCDINHFADNLARDGRRRVYRYVYDYKITPFWFPMVKWTGSVHGADQLAVIGTSSGQEESSDDIQTRRRLTKYYANFARTGDPNNSEEPIWQAYNIVSRSYIQIKGSSPSLIGNNYRTQECAVWKRLRSILRKTQEEKGHYCAINNDNWLK